MTVDYADWATAEKHALEIYNQTVPLGRKSVGVAQGTSLGIAGGGTATLVNAQAITQPSFQMLISLENVLNTGTVPFGKLKFFWTDNASGFQVSPDWCLLTAGFGSPLFTYVYGPARGDTLTVTLDNDDPTIQLFYNFGISQISHVYDDFEVRQDSRVTPNVFSMASSNMSMGVIGSTNPSVAASGQQNRLCVARNGRAILAVDNTGGAAAAHVLLLDPGVIAGGSPLLGIASSGIIAGLTVGAGTPQVTDVGLPRGPVVIQVNNTGAGAAISPTVTLTEA